MTVGLFLLAACAPSVPLADVEIVGGTAYQRQLAANELENFDVWAGVGRVSLTKVAFVPTQHLPDGDAGFYSVPRSRIEISEDLGSDLVGQSLRHELCHALDYQEGLLEAPNALFDDEADLIAGDPGHAGHAHLVGMNARDRRSEVLADVCEQAPLGTALLSEPCGDEPTEYEAIAEWVQRIIWTGDPDVVTDQGAALGPIAQAIEVPGEVETLEVWGSESADAALFQGLLTDGGGLGFSASTADASFALPVGDPTLAAIQDGYAATFPVGAPLVSAFDSLALQPVVAVADGAVFRVIADLGRGHLGGTYATHVIAQVGQEWSVIGNACPVLQGNVFLANGQMYAAWAEGKGISWSPLYIK